LEGGGCLSQNGDTDKACIAVKYIPYVIRKVYFDD